MGPFELCWAILTPLINLGPVFKFYLLSKMKTMGSQVLIIYWHTAAPTRTEEQGSRCVFKRATLRPKSIRRHIGCQAALAELVKIMLWGNNANNRRGKRRQMMKYRSWDAPWKYNTGVKYWIEGTFYWPKSSKKCTEYVPWNSSRG